MAPSMSAVTRWRAALAVILAVAAGLRVWGLAAEGLWADEAFVVALSRLELGGLFRLSIASDTHPPLHALLLRAWMRLFGSSEEAVRSLSVLFGVAGVGLSARLGARLLGEEAGLQAALLLATSPYHVYYSQETRGYTLLVLLAIASWDALVARMPGGANAAEAREPGLVYVLVTALMLYAQPYAVFILLAQNLYVLAAYRRNLPALGRWLRAQLLVAALFGPWVPILAGQAARAMSGFWIERPGTSHLLVTFAQYAGSVPAAIALGALVAAALVSVAKGGPPRAVGLLLGLWLTLPHLVPFVVSQFAAPMYLARAAIGSLPALLLLAVVPLRSTSRVFARVLVGGLAVFSVSSLAQYRAHGARDQWRETAAYVGAQAASGDLVAIDDGYGGYAFDYYKRSDLEVARLRDDVARPAGAAHLQAALRGRPRVWLIRYHRPPDHEALRTALGEGWRLVDYREWRNILLYRFERR